MAEGTRRLSAGVELQSDGGAHARVWAPVCHSVDFVFDGAGPEHPLTREPDGFFSGIIPHVAAGDRYWFRLDGGLLRPDPVSRRQPDGPHGPSMVVDPSTFAWTDGGRRGAGPRGQVLYELHVGTFTPEGTWAAAAAQVGALAELGITVIEMMPVADFPGRFGWGYDGVNLFAPTRLYGSPDDLRTFVDRAHAVGLAVILDVVYNHFGPDGNYLGDFSPDYFTDRHTNDWGRSINFEGPRPVRDLFVDNAGYWIDEFHFDGLRFDATQDMHDGSGEHVLVEIARRARDAGRGRPVLLIAENEPQQARLVRPREAGGYGLDALWNDDYHHSAFVALTGRREAYYTDYKGSAQELISCAKHGYLYQGQWYSWQKQRRGTPALDLAPWSFIAYLENHDQVANSLSGRRLHQLSSPARYRALTALTLLGPATPLLFQGQEFSSSAPFLFFADHHAELRGPIREGRRQFLGQFPSMSDPHVAEALASPDDEDTFRRSRLNWSERDTHTETYALHRDLIALRRRDPVMGNLTARRVDGAVFAPGAFVLRYFGDAAGDRLLIVNLGSDLDVAPAPEPLLAPPDYTHWALVWHSESIQYGGHGIAPLTPHAAWHVPGETAVWLASEAGPPDDDEQS